MVSSVCQLFFYIIMYLFVRMSFSFSGHTIQHRNPIRQTVTWTIDQMFKVRQLTVSGKIIFIRRTLL